MMDNKNKMNNQIIKKVENKQNEKVESVRSEKDIKKEYDKLFKKIFKERYEDIVSFKDVLRNDDYIKYLESVIKILLK